MSALDRLWRRFIVTKFYKKGWGSPADIKSIMLLRKRLGNREEFNKFLSKDYPVYIDKETQHDGSRILEGHFHSPLNEQCPGVMPKEVEIARFQMILPTHWKGSLRPVCLQMGGTGDHGFVRRRKFFAEPLLKDEGIASVILENPYYGTRKPPHQFRSGLLYVNDLFVMGASLIMEGNILLNWLDRQGYGPLGLSGVSMGGHMVSLAATNWPKPLSLIPCMSGSTAAGVFTHGVLSHSVVWKILEQQFMETEAFTKEILDLIESPEPYWKKRGKSMYQQGQDFFQDLERDSTYYDTHKVDSFMSQKHLTFGPTQTLGVDFTGDSNSNNSGQSHSALGRLNIFNPSGDLVNQSVNNCDNQSKTQNMAASPNNGWMSYFLSYLPAIVSSKGGKELQHKLEQDCRLFMRGMMDECTHLANFSVPVDPELIVIVRAENDAYIPHNGYLTLAELWPGSEVRTIPCGHVAGHIAGKYRKEFRKAIVDSFDLQARKYYNTGLRQHS